MSVHYTLNYELRFTLINDENLKWEGKHNSK